ncbi:MAG: glutaredoxin family protein [Haloferacaceae archaeon]
MPRDVGADHDITLYRLHGCPFCERVARRLDECDVPYHSVFVPAEHSRRDAVARLAGTRSVPVLVDDDAGVTMAESANVVAYIDRTYGPDGADGEGGAGR